MLTESLRTSILAKMFSISGFALTLLPPDQWTGASAWTDLGTNQLGTDISLCLESETEVIPPKESLKSQI